MSLEQEYTKQNMRACVMLAPHCFGEGKFSAEQIYNLVTYRVLHSDTEAAAVGGLLDYAKGCQYIVDYIYYMLYHRLWRVSSIEHAKNLLPVIQALSETQIFSRLVEEGKFSQDNMNEILCNYDYVFEKITVLNKYGEKLLSFAQDDQKIIGWLYNLFWETSVFQGHWVESVERFVSYTDLLSYLKRDSEIDIYKLLDGCMDRRPRSGEHTHIIDVEKFNSKIKNQIHITECDNPLIQDLVGKYDVSYLKNSLEYDKWTDEEKQSTFHVEFKPHTYTQQVRVELCDQNGDKHGSISIPSPEGVAILQKIIDDKFAALMAGFELHKATVALEQAAISEDVCVMDPDGKLSPPMTDTWF